MTTTYKYNGDGDRISQTVNDGTSPVTTTYVLDTATPLTMVLSETTGAETVRYWHGLDTLAQSDGTSVEYFGYDGLGSVRQLVDASGSVGLAQTFDPYGNGYAKAGSAQSTLGYTGEQTDANGFVFLRARYYQPGMGRFTQMDPSRQESNPYLYGASNPVMFVDPSGWVALPKVDEATGILLQEYLMDWYGLEHGDVEDVVSARERREKAAGWAMQWAPYSAGARPWGTTPTGPTTNRLECFDCIRFVSYILWRVGFRMYDDDGDFRNGQPAQFVSGRPLFGNQDVDKGWTASGVTNTGLSGSTKAFWNTVAFVTNWTQPKNREGIPRATLLGTCDSLLTCMRLLRSLSKGDVVLYDYNDWEKKKWDHAAMLVNEWPTPNVASRGNSIPCETYIGSDGKEQCPPETNKYLCSSGFPNASFIYQGWGDDVTGDQTFENGKLIKVGALRINYEQYDHIRPGY